MSDVEKVLIIGSGPAGLTSAIYTSRALLKPLMIEGEEPGGQLTTTTDVENYPGFPDGIMGPDLMVVMRQQAERFGTRFVSSNVTKVDFSSRPFKVWVGDKEYQSESVIVSTGATAKYLGLESEKKFMGRGVSACATCDGAFFKGVPVLIVGGGDTAMEEAIFLTRFASKVFLANRSEEFKASKIMLDKVKANDKIEIMVNTELKEVHGDRGVNKVTLYNNKSKEDQELDVEGVFIAIGHKPNTDLFKDVLEMDANGYLITKPDSTYTSVDGVFAGGDVQDHVYRQAVTAAGTGCMAAIDCERWLEKQGK